MSRYEYDATFKGVDYPPALLRRAALSAIDLKRRVSRRLDALAGHPDFGVAAREFRDNWMDGKPKWMQVQARKVDRD